MAWETAVSFALCLVFSSNSYAASVTINGPSALQKDIIALSTNTYNATIAASLFPGSYTVNLLSKKPPMIPEIEPNSTDTYVYGFEDGQEYERAVELHIIYGFLLGSTELTVSSQTLHDIYKAIYETGFSTQTVINLP